jgi:toxin ParE1/3/4
MKIKWTKRASQNLHSIVQHIENDNPIAAKEFYKDTIQKISVLTSFPMLGRAGIVPKIRELVIHENYIVYYRVDSDSEQVQIVRVLHVKRKYP